ncbi:MarR family winged helix-turn-helix transcriptional regulator [Nocardia fusca]|uniref:MarR family winged helix-turn-helix transcriptional regulator n=1 Tax=Nocardia fusca TaxID=941183 RepID=UPI0012F4DD40|nr:MarR family winged helix-turn-helix transcriptional regulator [Nocardia fusca]
MDDPERQGLAERRRDECDRHGHAVHLTPSGRERLAAAATTTDRVMAGLPAPLSAGDRRNLHGLLARFLEHTAGTE